MCKQSTFCLGLQDVHDQTNATVEDSRCLHGNVERQDDEAVMALLSSKPKRWHNGCVGLLLHLVNFLHILPDAMTFYLQ